jgi:hypothetical protein
MCDYDPRAAGPSLTVDAHVHRLRDKLVQAGAQEMVQTGARGRLEGSPDERAYDQQLLVCVVGKPRRACCRPAATEG